MYYTSSVQELHSNLLYKPYSYVPVLRGLDVQVSASELNGSLWIH